MIVGRCLILFLLSFLLIHCAQQESPHALKRLPVHPSRPIPPEENPHLVDYKSDVYRIAVGENFRISAKKIAWNWAAMADRDGVLDSTGLDNYVYFGEPLISFNDNSWLPVLHIETRENQIVSFTCSMLFDMPEDPAALDDLFKELGKSISLLNNEFVIHCLKTNGEFATPSGACLHSIKLWLAGRAEYSRFEYTMKFDE